MTDEEGDLVEFQAYLHSLTPEALWDVLSHVDEDLYPRRREAAQREVLRRRLFFVTPYTPAEVRLRGLFGCSLLASALAAGLHGVASIPVHLEPWEHLTFFYDLAAGGPPAANMVLPLERFLATVGEAGVLVGVAIAAVRLIKRRLARDVFASGVGALALGAVFLAIAYQ